MLYTSESIDYEISSALYHSFNKRHHEEFPMHGIGNTERINILGSLGPFLVVLSVGRSPRPSPVAGGSGFLGVLLLE